MLKLPMGLILEIIEGIQKGECFRLADKMTLGRKKADIMIKDPNISTLHAIVLIDDNGIPILVDQGSRNGLIVNESIVQKIALYPGTIFMVGNTEFVVKSLSDEEIETLFPSKTWRELFRDDIEKATLQSFPSDEITAFNPRVELKFIAGVQTDLSYVLGFGPRTAGFYYSDISLMDPHAPDIAFKISPTKSGAFISNFDINSVFLNGKKFESASLANGDKIQFGESQIAVLYIDS